MVRQFDPVLIMQRGMVLRSWSFWMGTGSMMQSYIPDFIEAMNTGKADVVIGSRFLEKNKTIPKYRIVGMKVLNMFTRFVGNMETTDSQSGYRAYSRRAIEEIRIRNPDMGAGSEILTRGRGIAI